MHYLGTRREPYGKYGKLNDTVLFKGRVKCNCQASKRKLIINCLYCVILVCTEDNVG